MSAAHPTKRRRVEMPALADGFNDTNTSGHRTSLIPKPTPVFNESRRPPPPSEKAKERPLVPIVRPFVSQTPPKPQNVHLRPPPPPPQLPSNPKTPLKQIIPPTFPVPTTISKPLNPPPPPPPPLKLKSKAPEQDKDLKTISTTSIGLLNALSSSNGGEDLAAFLLPHRDLSSSSSSNAISATSRGVELSPEKRGKGHVPKFIKGGLAARASALYNRAHTSLVLWQKETERRATNSRTSGTVPDMMVTVVNVVYFPRPLSPSGSNAKKLLPVVALCKIHQTESTMGSGSYASNQLYKVVFSVPYLTLDRFKEGITVRVFHPWHELSFDQPPSDATVALPIENGETSSSGPNRRRSYALASLPLPLSLPSTPDLPVNKTTAVLCSRFIF